jgi:hypothetical protein
LSPFETQKRSFWFRNMLEQAKYNIEVGAPWQDRALVALSIADMDGTFTSPEIERHLTPFIGPAESRHSVDLLLRKARNRGLVRRLDTKRCGEGDYRPSAEYKFEERA